MCHWLNNIIEITMAPSNNELTEGIRKHGVVKKN